MISSLPALSIPSAKLHDIIEMTNLQNMKVDSVRREEPGADVLCGARGYTNIFWRMECQ